VRPSTEDASIPSTTTNLRGHRHRLSRADCANAYLAHLEFQQTRDAQTKDGSTRGSGTREVASHHVASESVVRIPTATKARHRHRLDGDRLTRVDGAACAFDGERDESLRLSGLR